MSSFIQYLTEHNIDYIKDSIYLCDDGITFMYKDTTDILHCLILDIREKRIVEEF